MLDGWEGVRAELCSAARLPSFPFYRLIDASHLQCRSRAGERRRRSHHRGQNAGPASFVRTHRTGKPCSVYAGMLRSPRRGQPAWRRSHRPDGRGLAQSAAAAFVGAGNAEPEASVQAAITPASVQPPPPPCQRDATVSERPASNAESAGADSRPRFAWRGLRAARSHAAPAFAATFGKAWCTKRLVYAKSTSHAVTKGCCGLGLQHTTQWPHRCTSSGALTTVGA